MKTANKGFTLIELMVTVAIVAILASIAIPSYRQYAIRNAESQAQAKMKQLQIELERWQGRALTYKGFLPKKIANDGTVSYSYDTGASGDGASTVIYVPANSAQNNYQYKILLVDGDNTANSLVTTASSTLSNSLTAGRAWVMFATPNPTKFNDAHKILLTSSGAQCKAKNIDSSVSVIPTSCDTNWETW